jgi:cell division initiation protein
MRITPLDVRKQEFRKGMRGLDAEEVYAFLSTVADEYEAVLNDNKALRERLLELDDKVLEYRSMEKTLRDTLLTAERVTVDAKDNARREANLIIKEAQIEAEKALRNIKNESMQLRQQVQQLRAQREGYLAKMRVVAESHLNFIESAQGDFEEEDEGIRGVAPTEEHRPEPSNSSLFEARVKPVPPAQASPEAPIRTPEIPAHPAPATAPAPSVAPAPAVVPPPSPSPAPTEAPQQREAGPSASATPEGAPQDIVGMADLSAILERMKQGQKDVLEAAGTEAETPAPATGAQEDFAPLAETATATEERNPWAAVAGPDTDEAAPELEVVQPTVPSGNDVTSEWDMEQIRRDLMRKREDGES